MPPPPQVEQIKIKEETRKDEPKKRKRKPENEIDELFDAALGKKIRKAALATIPVSEEKEGVVVVKGEKEVKEEEDKSLKAVLGAIRSAPKGEEKHKKKRKKV